MNDINFVRRGGARWLPRLRAPAGPDLPDRQVTEREARSSPGLPMLAAGIVGLVAGVALAVVASHQSHGAAIALVVLCVLIFIASALTLAGLTPVIPGQARVVQLFGRYHGTISDSGLQWVNPFNRRIAVSTRISNQESARSRSTTPMATRSRSPP